MLFEVVIFVTESSILWNVLVLDVDQWVSEMTIEWTNQRPELSLRVLSACFSHKFGMVAFTWWWQWGLSRSRLDIEMREYLWGAFLNYVTLVFANPCMGMMFYWSQNFSIIPIWSWQLIPNENSVPQVWTLNMGMGRRQRDLPYHHHHLITNLCCRDIFLFSIQILEYRFRWSNVVFTLQLYFSIRFLIFYFITVVQEYEISPT